MELSKDYEILKNPIFSLPLNFKEQTCEEGINRILSEYETFLVNNNLESVIIHESVNMFKHKIKEMFEEYYVGHQNLAYQNFKEAFEYETGTKLPLFTALPKEPLYRARINDGNDDFEKKEMFHIKYSLRGKVKTQRFSFPGLPCLYLGASSYVCWLELNRPEMTRFQVAEIRQKDENKGFCVIDLGLHALDFYDELKRRNKEPRTEHGDLSFSDYLRWWPIMAMCSISVKNEEDPFKPEYIFPQFVLQYFLEEIKNENCVGIKYFSIKAGRISKRQYEADYRTYTNYVIPVKSTNEEDEFCNVLKDQFEVSNTISGKEHQVISGMIKENGIKWYEIGEKNERKNKGSLDDTIIFTKNGIPLQYGRSEFRMIEKALSGEIMGDLVDNSV